MKKSKENKEYKFRLFKISTEQFAILDDNFNKAQENIEMKISLKYGLDTKKRIIAVLAKVQFEHDNQPFLVLEIANHFEIEKKSWEALKKTKNGIVIPKNLASHLVMLTIGTLRGTLHCKTEKTQFNNLILPAINLNNLIKDDIVLDKQIK